MYVMLCICPNVFYTLSMMSRYRLDPSEHHWIVVKNILTYLRKTKDAFLIYGGEEELVIKGYIDPNFQSNKEGSKL